MAINYHIKPFTAADIEKYHKGLLSAKEMHDMEKAALDDPFLADALEGYAVEGVNTIDDIEALKQKLNERTERKTVVVPITPANRSSNLWLKIAAMIVLIAGGGLLVYQLGFNTKKESPVVQSKQKDENTEQVAVPSANESTNGITNADKQADQAASAETVQKQNETANVGAIAEEKAKEFNGNAIAKRKDTIAISRGFFDNSVASSSVRPDNAELKKLPDSDGDDASDNLEDKALDGRVAGVTVAKSSKEEAIKLKDVTAGNKQANGNAEDLLKKMPGMVVSPAYTLQQQARRNIFRGTITDQQNNPLPFANITNTADNVGTYADVKGNFVLTSPDSVLNVQVRSVGFSNNNYALRYDPLPNRIVMSEDRNSLAEVVISRNGRPDSIRSRGNSMVLEEPEPVDGWNNYDTYLANNLNVPESYRSTRQSSTGGKVEVSFEVDGQGEPINIRVEKSLCEACDKEAIRLIKDGPKFKRKAKKNGRTTVSISF